MAEPANFNADAAASAFLASAEPSDADPDSYAQDCLAALAVASRASGSQVALARASRMADRLVKISNFGNSGIRGWTYSLTKVDKRCETPGALHTFQNKRCNPPGTPYMWQTSQGLMCLARTTLLTKDQRYLPTLRAVIRSSWDLGAIPANCRSCFYYWYSYDPADKGRYVRNTNAMMGAALAWAGLATGDATYTQRALAVAHSEEREFSAMNFGYDGVDDPEYMAAPAAQADYIENHATAVIKADYDISNLLHRPRLAAGAVALWDRWNRCDNARCRAGGCAIVGAPASCSNSYTFTPCILSEVSPPAATQCAVALQYAQENHKKLSAYAVWLVADRRITP